jgi:hypothetical protein
VKVHTAPVQQPEDIGSLVNGSLVNSEVVASPLQVVAGSCGTGPATRGLKPTPPASVDPSGTAPSLKSEPLTSPGVGGGDEAAAQPGEASDALNPGVADAVTSVASTGKFAAIPAPFTAHWLILPAPLFASGLAKFR